MKRYRVNVFAKGRGRPEIYSAKTINAEDDASAKTAAEPVYREYERRANGTKHSAVFYEILDEERLVYSSSPSWSVWTSFVNLMMSVGMIFRAKMRGRNPPES